MEAMRAVLDGRRPERPTLLDQLQWEVIRSVWTERADERPGMATVAKRLRDAADVLVSYS